MIFRNFRRVKDRGEGGKLHLYHGGMRHLACTPYIRRLTSKVINSNIRSISNKGFKCAPAFSLNYAIMYVRRPNVVCLHTFCYQRCCKNEIKTLSTSTLCTCKSSCEKRRWENSSFSMETNDLEIDETQCGRKGEIPVYCLTKSED